MESSHGLLEELLAPRRDNHWTTFPNEVNELFNTSWSFDPFDESPDQFATPNPNSFLGLITSPLDPAFSSPFSEIYPLLNGFTSQDIHTSYDLKNITTLPIPSIVDHCFEDRDYGSCKVEKEQPTSDNIPVFNTGLCGERKSKSKKVEGQPSKNLMAERRRRKRLNDRLSMLRSIVPKISKMDRTAILGDTIDYMKELLGKIQNLQEGDMKDINQMNLMGNFKDLNVNDIIVRNPPKFDVERRKMDTRIEICCAAKPGLLLSTVNTLEALGIDIHQCVLSCFNDFSMQASCSEAEELQTVISSEEIKQALFRNAGYGGRCL